MELQKIMDDIVCWSMTRIQSRCYFIRCYAEIFPHDGFKCCTALWCHYRVYLNGSRRVCYRNDGVRELPSSTGTLAVLTDMRHRTELAFVDEFRWVSPLHYAVLSMKREGQQDATIRCLLLTSVSTCFGHHYAHLQEKKGSVTPFGVLFWFCWMWLVAVVGRCLVGCEHCEGFCSVSTCFGHHYAHLQEKKTMLLHLVCCSGSAGCGW